MELKQLRYFLVVAGCGSLTRAAEKLYITPQALSKSILKLEKELEVPLFERNIDGLTLTEYGSCILPYVQKTMRDVDATMMAVDEMKQRRTYSIRMGFVIGSFHSRSAITPQMLADWENSQGNANVFVQECAPEELKQMVLNDDLDLAYVIQKNDEFSSQLRTCLLGREPVAIVAPPGLLPEKVTFSDLQNIPVLIGRIGEDPSKGMLDWYEYASYTPKINYYNGPFNQCAERVRIREGIVISGLSLCRVLAQDGLEIRMFPNAEAHMNHYLIWKGDRAYPGYVTNLISYLKKTAKAT